MIRTAAQKRNRTAELAQVAKELGMEFSVKDEWGLIALLRDFELFQKGGRRRITNIMSKETGLMEEKINICDYQFTISTGKSAHTYYQTFFFMQSKELGLPEMLIYPEKFFHKIGSLLGMQDIDFEEWPEFSSKFLVQGDEWGVRRLMDEGITKFFLSQKNWCLESIGFYLVFYRKKALVKPRSIKVLYNKGMELYEYLKEKK
ncbi:MAG TPA: hypothetical protein ENJ95_19700 [Bacteroidetes bacterium]|nr:hypothetical protein [Bacteroidota bacterium]